MRIMMWENKKAVIFDLDGTLVDSIGILTSNIWEGSGYPYRPASRRRLRA